MENIIFDILGKINEDILFFEGENLLYEEVIDSFDIMEIVSAIEEAFHIEIDAELISADKFANKYTIISLVKESLE